MPKYEYLTAVEGGLIIAEIIEFFNKNAIIYMTMFL